MSNKSIKSRNLLKNCRTILQISYEHSFILYLYENLHERYHLFPRRPMSQDQVINAWFVK